MRAIRGCISTMIKWGNASAIQDDLISLMGELDEDRTVEEKGDLSVCRSENFHNALRDLNDSLMPTRAHGLICLKRLILAGDETVLQNWKRVLQHLEICLSDGESYIYLSAINTLAALCLRKTDQTLPILLQAFENQERTIQERLNVAEVIVRVSRNLQESPKYSQLFFRTFMRSLKDPDEMIRVSTLSKMGHFCSHLGSALEPFVGEIFHTVYSLIRNDESLSVKRASLMMLHLTLTGIDGQLFQVRSISCCSRIKLSFPPEQMIQKYGSQLHSLMQEAYTNDPDDVSRLHAQLVLEEMDRIAGERIYSLSKSASHHQIK